MRVLILTPDIYMRGGIARYTATLASALGDLLGPDNVHVQPLRGRGGGNGSAGTYRVLPPITSRLSATSKVRFTARGLALGRRKYHLVVCTHIGLAPVAALVRMLFGTPFWVTCHGREAWPRFPADVRWAMERADLILPISRFTAETVEKVNGIPQSKMRVLYNAIPDDFARLLMSGNGTAAGFKGHERIILSVGTVAKGTAYKGYDVVIQALPKVLQAVPNARYQIVGDGDDLDCLKKLADDTGVRDRVEFKGSVSDAELLCCYRQCDVFVLPSRTAPHNGGWHGEGFGRVYVEAALAGKPVIGSTGGGAAEAVLHGKTGLLVDPTSVSEVAEALIMLLGNPELSARMGTAGRYWARERFMLPALRDSLEKMLKNYGLEAQWWHSWDGSETRTVN